MPPLTTVLYGVGNVGQAIARMLLERGVRIVGAIGRETNLGRDLGELVGWPQPLGVRISADADQVLRSARGAVAILTVGETMAQSMPHLERCVRHGCHVISLSEQVFHPWACDPELSTRIDALAKQHRVVVSASGMQDHLWLNLPLILSAGCHRITSIEGVSVVNADIFGPAVVKENGIGDLPSSIEKLQTSTPERANVFTYSLLSLAAALELNVVDWSQDLRPVVAPHRIKSDSLGRYIDPGQLQGCITGSRVRTRENIELIGDVVLKVFEPQETDLTRWTIKGSAELTAECPNTQAHIATGATVINRLPDVLTAPPGLQTVHALRAPRFRAQLSS